MAAGESSLGGARVEGVENCVVPEWQFAALDHGVVARFLAPRGFFSGCAIPRGLGAARVGPACWLPCCRLP
eukprot:16423673-Heterocapsa_arctica.AAC.1